MSLYRYTAIDEFSRYRILGAHVEHSAFSSADFLRSVVHRLAWLGVRHKLIRPYTPRHNGKVERSHREDQKRFYDADCFFSLTGFRSQLAVHHRRSNSIPMRPLDWLSPVEAL